MSDRTIGILGLGIFGSSVLTALAKQNMNIIAIDDHAERINQFEPVLARGVVGDITDEELLRTAGIDTCDTVVVATGENLESSVLAVMHCKSLGVPRVIVKVKSQTAKKVLEKIGADSVISPEYEMGQSLAQTILFHNNVDAVLVKVPMIAETKQIQLQRLGLYHFLIWYIRNIDCGKVWLTCHRTQAGELRTVKLNKVIIIWVLVIKRL